MCMGVYRFGEDKLCELNVCEMSVGFPNEDDQWTVKNFTIVDYLKIHNYHKTYSFTRTVNLNISFPGQVLCLRLIHTKM